MFKVVFKGKQAGEILLEREASVLAAAAKGKVDLTHRCGGHARCGTCIVTVEEGCDHLTPVGGAEERILGILKAKPGQRLGCQAWAQGDVTCRID
ncbi:MAG: 2Fe-2S iron-sulfur cluster-binding protein [Holophaga sp.]|jgi:ferredoxin